MKDYAKMCITKGGSRIHARQLTRRTKVFVTWSESYLYGKPGDYLAARAENPKDIYIIRQDILAKTYQRV